ncbi:MAG: Crp/Fnr family transcriptional regulator [Gammaproteobacteria bacterium]|nr:Crp/Fnr family transcriptional regulator [Gammaproteobacteria bacterium]
MLDALPAETRRRLLPHLQRVPMALGEVICEPGRAMGHVYFPTSCIVSLLYVTRDGESNEIVAVGNEGMVGISAFMGSESTTTQSMVRNAGHAHRLPAQVLKDTCDPGGPLHRLLLRYAQARITEMAQTAACNRHHSIDQQLCRWLLMQVDRLDSDEMTMTQELIASMLGVRREGVTAAVGKLQRAGLIDHHRGHLTVRDRGGLEARACECYRVVKIEFARLLPELNL